MLFAIGNQDQRFGKSYTTGLPTLKQTWSMKERVFSLGNHCRWGDKSPGSDHVCFWKGNPTNPAFEETSYTSEIPKSKPGRRTCSQSWKLTHGARKILKMTRTACFAFILILLMAEIRPTS